MFIFLLNPIYIVLPIQEFNSYVSIRIYIKFDEWALLLNNSSDTPQKL